MCSLLGKWFLRCFLQWYWLTVVYGHSVHLNTLHTQHTGESLPELPGSSHLRPQPYLWSSPCLLWCFRWAM